MVLGKLHGVVTLPYNSIKSKENHGIVNHSPTDITNQSSHSFHPAQMSLEISQQSTPDTTNPSVLALESKSLYYS